MSRQEQRGTQWERRDSLGGVWRLEYACRNQREIPCVECCACTLERLAVAFVHTPSARFQYAHVGTGLFSHNGGCHLYQPHGKINGGILAS